jgi:hypothetical protein
MFISKETKMYKTVYVVAWEYGSGPNADGGGFNWYFTADTARIEYGREQEHEQIDISDWWRTFIFSINVEHDKTVDEITQHIDERLTSITDLLSY